ncbi:hypothetical protein [Nostoc sp.]
MFGKQFYQDLRNWHNAIAGDLCLIADDMIAIASSLQLRKLWYKNKR